MLLTQRVRPECVAAPFATHATSQPFDCLSSRGNGKVVNGSGVGVGGHGVDTFLADVEREFRRPLRRKFLHQVSSCLQTQFREKLGASDICMLPSYSDALPSGLEAGEYLVADLGGTLFRVARVRLSGRRVGGGSGSRVVRRWDFPITESARSLIGRRFFEWMAEAIGSVHAQVQTGRDAGPLPLGLAWSFPLSHESRRSAGLLQMGKSFRAVDGLLGEDLGRLVEEACWARGVNVQVAAIVNDGTSSLISQMYRDASTSMAVVLGTGLNAAIHLPAAAVPSADNHMSDRAGPNEAKATSALVNTEVSMFGDDAYDLTPWDLLLKTAHAKPHFQPLEQLTSGRYLGEIVRLVLVGAIRSHGLFGGELPDRFGPYELETSTLSIVEGDSTHALSQACATLDARHPRRSGIPHSTQDLLDLRRVSVAVSTRAAAYLATAIHALWRFKRGLDPVGAVGGVSSVSCLGSVLNRYPRFMSRAQDWLDQLTADAGHRIRLASADDGECLVGAAVAVALGDPS